jgi:hypothetical protein
VRPKTRAQLFAEYAVPAEVSWRGDPVRWAEERARVEIWSKQREILRAVTEHPRVAIRSAHSTGKTFTMGLLTCWWIDTHPAGEARVITTAPTSKQVDAVLWNEINQHHSRLKLAGRTNRREWYIGQFLAALGRKPPDHVEAAFQGLHARYLLVLLDEAFGVPKHLWDEASTLASNENARMVAVGNPDGDGEFERICRPDSGWHVIHISYRDTPNFTGELVSPRLREMLVSRAWVETCRLSWGQESALFQSKCEGNFPTVGNPWQVVPLDWANACRFLELADDQATLTEAGVDVAAGNDRTVVTIRRGDVILHIQSFTDSDPVRTVGAIALTLREWNVQCVKVDSIGVGWGVYGHLRSLSSKHSSPGDGPTAHDASVVPINVGTSPTYGNGERFVNRRAEMWWDVGRERCRQLRWDFSRLERDVQGTLIHELTLPHYQIVDAQGKLKVEPKKKIIERLGASPDVAESVLLAFVPASWTAELQAGELLAAPSLLESLSPGALSSTSGAAVGGLSGGYGGPNGVAATSGGSPYGDWTDGRRGW